MASKNLTKVIMRSTESRYFYTTTKNRKKTEKLALRRYDPIIRKHTDFKEEKMR